MAVIWQHAAEGRTYEVRTAGKSVRLITNGVFHSQWNSKRCLTRSVWDCLTLPGYFLPATQPSRVLMLGVGGGAAIRQLQHFFSPQEIIGVDLDPIHLSIARRWFAVRGRGVSLVCADATEWLSAYRGPKFDMVIDDLFADEAGARRAVEVDREWARQLRRVLRDDGVLVVNFDDRRSLRESGLASRHGGLRIASRYILEQPHYANAVGVYLPSRRTRRHWNVRIAACDRLSAVERSVARGCHMVRG